MFLFLLLQTEESYPLNWRPDIVKKKRYWSVYGQLNLFHCISTSNVYILSMRIPWRRCTSIWTHALLFIKVKKSIVTWFNELHTSVCVMDKKLVNILENYLFIFLNCDRYTQVRWMIIQCTWKWSSVRIILDRIHSNVDIM